jgi:micrococcal nuclease
MTYIPYNQAAALFLFAAVLLISNSFSALATAAEFRGTVVAVLDGEVIAVKHDGQPEEIRLHGVECPDKDKRLAKRAKDYLAKRALGQTVTVVTLESDQDGRMVSDVFLASGDMLNALVIQAGLAWTDGTAYGVFSDMEDEARAAGRGMWSRSGPKKHR